MSETTTNAKTARRPRRTAAAAMQTAAEPKIATGRRRRAGPAPAPAPAPEPESARQSKLDLVVAQLSRPDGANLAELVAATGWQRHSVRGALAGALKKKGHTVTSEKVDGERRYRIGSAE